MGLVPNVFRDSGCTTVCVKADLVHPDQYTGKSEACVLIDGVVKCYPTAVVEIDSPFYKGKAKALCMEKPLHDLIIGNIEGAKLPRDLDFAAVEANEVTQPEEDSEKEQNKEISVERGNENDKDIEDAFAEVRNISFDGNEVDDGNDDEKTDPREDSDESEQQIGEAVITRSMAKREDRPMSSLKTANIDVSSINCETLKEEQKSDETLKNT
jgi:hypothetical protein